MYKRGSIEDVGVSMEKERGKLSYLRRCMNELHLLDITNGQS